MLEPGSVRPVSPPLPILPSVVTMLSPAERASVDAAGMGLYRAYHRDSFDDVIRDVKECRVCAVLVSVARCGERDSSKVAGLVREFPRIPAVALLTGLDVATPRTVLSLGQSGVRTLIDVRQPNGWRELRDVIMADRSGDIGRVALAQLVLDLVGAPEDCWRFFEALFTVPARVSTVRQLARQLQVLPTTLMSRFFRARLPAPKRYLALARLTRAARVLENPGLSIADVGNHLEYSSPQSFGRHIRTMVGFTAIEFRRRYTGERMLQRFRDELVLPFHSILREFSPLTARPRWIAEKDQKGTNTSS